jgi:hypothetical protein
MKSTGSLLYILICIGTAMVGYQIHHSEFWSVVNFFFAPISWVVWLICHDVTLTVIKHTFAWFFV